jgi:methylenetetrahydrofolate reductase (NADPH)
MSISLEFFPPKDLDFLKVVACLNDLTKLNPKFVSITWGALGNSEEKSIGLIQAIKNASDIEVVSHLTLVNKSRNQINEIAKNLTNEGIKRIVAIRGDSPDGKFKSHPEGFSATSEFVAFLKAKGFEVTVSAYPEPHPMSKGLEFDLDILERKVAAGATKAITQFCFDTRQFEILKNSLAQRNINIELIAGIMPIYNFDNVCNMAARCGAQIPLSIIKKFEGKSNDDENLSVQIAVDQITELKDIGYDSFHVYTLNKSNLINKIFNSLS